MAEIARRAKTARAVIAIRRKSVLQSRRVAVVSPMAEIAKRTETARAVIAIRRKSVRRSRRVVAI